MGEIGPVVGEPVLPGVPGLPGLVKKLITKSLTVILNSIND